MQKILFFLIALFFSASVFADRNIGTVTVQGGTTITIPVSVSSASPELQRLAQFAFNIHGKYRLVSSGAFVIKFTASGCNQITVDISHGSGSSIFNQTVAGTSLRHALLKAIDVAIEKTSGLKGFFNGKLVFVAERDGQQTIVTGDVLFGNLQSYPVSGKQIVGPRWSPDGEKILFTSYRSYFPDIYLLDLRTRQLKVLVNFKGTNSCARFSPDGSKVAMVLSGEGNPEIYVGNVSSRQVRRLTHTPSVEASPAWSPDGSCLVFTSDAAGGPQLFVMSASGGTMSRLPINISKYCTEPDWSWANPNKIVFTAGVGHGYQIAVYDSSQRSAKIVSSAPMDAIEPVWLADARHVICTFRSAGSSALYLLDTETGNATCLSPSGLGNVWSASYLAL